jgi:hypothetical protein
MTASEPTQRRGADEPEAAAALDRVSTVIQRALLRVMEHEERAARRAAADRPPSHKRVVDIPPESTAPSQSTSTTDFPLSSGEAHGA